MKKLSKGHREEQERLVKKLISKRDDVEDGLSKCREAVKAYNEVVREAEEWRSNIVDAMDDYYEGRSESWQESDAGSAYMDWKDEWEAEELSEVDLPDEMSLEQPDTLDGLSQEPGQ